MVWQYSLMRMHILWIRNLPRSFHPILSSFTNIPPVAQTIRMMASSSWCKTQEELQLNGVVHSIAFCKETCNVLLCDSFHWTVEQLSYSSSSGLSLQPKKMLKLGEQQNISNPTSVQIARKMGSILIGCDSDEGISVLDRNSLQLVRKFAQNMSRDFDYMVVDETKDLQCSTVYASSTNSGTLTKFDYNSGSILGDLSVTLPSNIILKENKLYLICQNDSSECVLVIDKHSLKIQSKFVLSGWSSLGGLCLDDSSNVCVTACNESNQRIIYSFDDGGNIVGQVQLTKFDEDAVILDMVAAGNDLIILTQEPGPEFFLNRIEYKF